MDYFLAVIIPCWNCKPYIGEMLDCLLNQTFTDWKAFLVDDWCTDGTTEIVKEYAAKDARIQYFKRNREPKGAQTCRNIGFELSEGAKYVVFFDADDLIAPYCFEQRVVFMEAHQELGMGVFPAKAFKQNIYDEENNVYGLPFISDDLEAFLNWNLPFTVWTNIYRRDAYNIHSLQWDEKVLSLQDSFFNICALASGIKYAYSDNAKFDYFYRIGHVGVAKKIKTLEHYESHLYYLNRIANIIENNYGNKYGFFVQNLFLLCLIQVFNCDKSMLNRMIDLSWVKTQYRFRVKLMLYSLFNMRGKSYLFKKHLTYSRSMASKWQDHMKVLAEGFRQNP